MQKDNYGTALYEYEEEMELLKKQFEVAVYENLKQTSVLL